MEYKGDKPAIELIKDHDTIVITAWRYTDDCGDKGNILPLSKKKMNNKKLEREISEYDYDYGKGHFVEGNMHVIEDVFVVYDTKDNKKLINLAKKLSEKYLQYSVLILPVGKVAYLYGTTHCPDAKPPFHKTMELGKPKSGKGDPAWTTIIKSGEEFTA